TGGEPLLFRDAVLPVDDLGPVPGLLTVHGGELNDAVVQRPAVEGDLARHLLAVPRVAATAEGTEGDSTQAEWKKDSGSAHDRPLIGWVGDVVVASHPGRGRSEGSPEGGERWDAPRDSDSLEVIPPFGPLSRKNNSCPMVSGGCRSASRPGPVNG